MPAASTAPAKVKPAWRGVLHHWAAVAFAGAGVVLTAMAPTARAAAAAAGYALSVVTLFAVSAAYHRPTWSPPQRARMRRLDHAAIFVLIAGTYTPISLLGVRGPEGAAMLWAVWAGAAVGVVKSVLWAHAPRAVTAAVYLLVGWTVAPFFGAVRDALTAAQLALLLGGGVAYTLGAVVYALRRPDPAREVFGYHEVFHALTLVACAAHFALVLQLVAAAR